MNMSTNQRAAVKQRLNNLAWLLDSSIPIPGFNFRIGLDGLISLIPFVGDAIGTLLSSYILAEAARLQVPKTVLMRMGFNVLIDAVIGAIPFFGDFFDFAWKANNRNVRLLEKYADQPVKEARSSTKYVVFFIIGLIILVILIAILGIWLLRLLFDAISA